MKPATKHGRRSTYARGCRCEKCSEANRVYQRRYFRRMTTVVMCPSCDCPLAVTLTPMPPVRRADGARADARVVDRPPGRIVVTVLRLSDHPLVRAQRRRRLQQLADTVLRLLDEGAKTDDSRIHRLLTPLPAGELAEVTALLEKAADEREGGSK